MTDERRDDEILGRALARAIETIDASETPYEQSRLIGAGRRRPGFGLWQFAGAAAALLLAVGVGAWFIAAREGAEPAPAGASPNPSAPAAASPTPAQSTLPRQTTAPTSVDRTQIYLARPALPPIGVAGPKFANTDATAVSRISSRLTALRAYRQSAAPPGLTNYLWNNSFQGGLKVTVASDVTTVDLLLERPFLVKDHSEAVAILQQLVYTATEEPGIRRVVLTENGGQPLIIGDIHVDKPLVREDVYGYTVAAPKGITWGGNDAIPYVIPKITSVSNDGTTTRLTILGTSGVNATATALQSFAIDLQQNDDTQPVGGKTVEALNGGKYQLRIAFLWNGGGTSGGVAGTSIVDQTPLRSIVSANPTFLIELDDARPWRAYMPDPTQLVIEIGGDPRAVSDRIAVYAPAAGTTVDTRISRTLTLSGAARVFEANVSWRLKNTSGKLVASGHFNASLGSSAMWGTFDTEIPIPNGVVGNVNVTLELFETSAKDGTEQGLVAVALALR